MRTDAEHDAKVMRDVTGRHWSVVRLVVADTNDRVPEAWTNVLAYVLQDELHNRLTPRVIDIAYTAFMQAKQPYDEDGRASDWFNDTRPVVRELIAKLRKDLIKELAGAPQPVPQGETNVQLDIDSNPATPGQQRDVAGPVAVGQPVGHRSDQATGDPQAQGDKLLIVAERNIRSFLRSAVFKSESDREAALNCVDVLWEAACASTNSQPAQFVDQKSLNLSDKAACASTVIDKPAPLLDRDRIREIFMEHGFTVKEGQTDLKQYVYDAADALLRAARAPTDSVREDAARWQMAVLVGNEVMLHPDKRSNPSAVKAYMEAVHSGLDLTGAVDAARKQGANHD